MLEWIKKTYKKFFPSKEPEAPPVVIKKKFARLHVHLVNKVDRFYYVEMDPAISEDPVDYYKPFYTWYTKKTKYKQMYSHTHKHGTTIFNIKDIILVEIYVLHEYLI